MGSSTLATRFCEDHPLGDMVTSNNHFLETRAFKSMHASSVKTAWINNKLSGCALLPVQHPVKYLELNLEPPLASNVSLVCVVYTSVVGFFGFAITLVPGFLLKNQHQRNLGYGFGINL
jgi:hypothetical protein